MTCAAPLLVASATLVARTVTRPGLGSRGEQAVVIDGAGARRPGDGAVAGAGDRRLKRQHQAAGEKRRGWRDHDRDHRAASTATTTTATTTATATATATTTRDAQERCKLDATQTPARHVESRFQTGQKVETACLQVRSKSYSGFKRFRNHPRVLDLDRQRWQHPRHEPHPFHLRCPAGPVGRALPRLLSLPARAAPSPKLLAPEKATARAPKVFKARFTTTKGDFTVEVHRDWAPLGADRFYNLIKIGYFDDAAVLPRHRWLHGPVWNQWLRAR